MGNLKANARIEKPYAWIKHKKKDGLNWLKNDPIDTTTRIILKKTDLTTRTTFKVDLVDKTITWEINEIVQVVIQWAICLDKEVKLKDPRWVKNQTK